MPFQGLSVTLAGVDITNHVLESSIQITHTLAQGSGTGNGVSGRASQCQFLVSKELGPIGSAVGGATIISSPQLVRLGQVIIKNAQGQPIFGGYATQHEDQTYLLNNYTILTCEDYFQFLDHTTIQDTLYDGVSDVFIINDLLATYAPTVDRSHLPTTGNYTFFGKVFKNVTVQKAIQAVVDTVGWQIWIDANAAAYYTTPIQAQTAPFGLTDRNADSSSTFYCQITDVVVDDSSTINRVYFYGGKRTSNDFTQDISTQANGVNTTFLLAYYPREASDGKVHVYKNGVNLAVGFANASQDKPANVLKSQGGTADVLLNSDAHTLTFDVAPLATDVVQAKYRYELPLVVVLTEQSSFQFYGKWLDGNIQDSNVIDTQTAIQRCRVLLLQQSFGLTTISVSIWHVGILAGQIVRLDSYSRNLHNSYVVQQVDTVPLGGGNFRYDLTLGAWNWNLVDVLLQLTQSTITPNDNTEQDNTPLHVPSGFDENIGIHGVWTTTSSSGPFYCGSAHSGFCTTA